MKISLNLQEATAIIDKLELDAKKPHPGVINPVIIDRESELESAALVLPAVIKRLKNALKEEVEISKLRLDYMVTELQSHGYISIEAELEKVKENVDNQGRKMQDKYFHENGTLKPTEL
jgi:hypothetical protein